MGLVLWPGWLVVTAGLALAKPPLSLEDIASLRAERTATAVVVRELRSRGRSFDIDAAARERLAGLGFTIRQLDVIAKAKKVDDEVRAAGPGGGKAAAVPAIERSPEDVARLERLERTVRRAAELAGGVTVVDTGHARLLLGPGVPQGLADDARKLEGLVARRFPGPLANDVDRRGVNIAVFVGESEYAEWITCLEKALLDEGFQFAEGFDFAEQARRAPAVYLDGLTTMRLAGAPDVARRTVAHAIGFHAIAQLSRDRCGDGLKSGFANVTETMLFGGPATTVKGGYAERELGAAAAVWPQLVRQRFADGSASSVAQVLDASFAVMELPHYAECWSFTEALCLKPQHFTRVVLELRQGGQPLDSITAVYEADANALAESWKGLAVQAR